MSTISMASGITRGRATSCCFLGIRTATARGLCGAASDWVGSCAITTKRRHESAPLPTEALRRFLPYGIRFHSIGFAVLSNSEHGETFSSERGRLHGMVLDSPYCGRHHTLAY